MFPARKQTVKKKIPEGQDGMRNVAEMLEFATTTRLINTNL
jgi:hypothetical protein